MWSARLLGRSLQASGDRRRRGMTVLDRTRLTGRFPLSPASIPGLGTLKFSASDILLSCYHMVVPTWGFLLHFSDLANLHYFFEIITFCI